MLLLLFILCSFFTEKKAANLMIELSCAKILQHLVGQISLMTSNLDGDMRTPVHVNSWPCFN